MDTDYLVPSEVDRIEARVSKVMGPAASEEEVETWSNVFALAGTQDGEPGAYALPATFGILADEADLDREIIIELEALAPGSDGAIVSRRVKTGFVRGESRLVRMALYRACEGVACGSGESCGCPGTTSCATPSCVEETIPPEDLEAIDNPSALPPDAGIATPDAGIPDGGVPPDDGGIEPDAGTPDGGGINCGEPLTLCGLDCVNTDADPRYCGDCETECPSGSVCESGTCRDPGDCRIDGTDCSGFTYCEESTGQCLVGCIETAQCEGDNQVCDAEIHECVCGLGFELCEVGCVNTQDDPSFCGDCTTVCADGFSCASGFCVDPGDCRTNDVGCSGFTYCDDTSGDCLRGCDQDVQCTNPNEVCDVDNHDCACAPDFHPCGNACVSDFDVASCGDLCTPCEAPPNSVAVCDLGVCGFECTDDYERCEQMCCPTSCPPGLVLYDRTCARVHIQVADPQGTRGEYASLALDAEGFAQIAHYASSGRDLILSSQQADASWLSESPDGPSDVGKYASIAADGAGVIYIAYYDESDDDLMLATRQSNGIWAVEVVDGAGDVGQHASLALDPSGVPHISYYDMANKDLMYATRTTGGAWAVETVDGDDGDDVGQYTSVAVGAGGTVHISYYASTGRDLRHATRTGSESWTIRTVNADGDRDVGKYSSLALDATGTAHISYYDESDKDLRYATQILGTFWITEPVEMEGNVGKFSSLAFDALGVARVSFYDESNRDLKYAIRLGATGWASETLDSPGDVGRYTSIEVDVSGNAHIAYYDNTNSDAKYALVAAPE
jgi:hypothetical protein